MPERPYVLTPDTTLSVITSNGPPRIPSPHGHSAKHAVLTLIRQASVFYAIEIQYVVVFPAATFGLSDRVATFGWQEPPEEQIGQLLIAICYFEAIITKYQTQTQDVRNVSFCVFLDQGDHFHLYSYVIS
jgi:hypothetical protein